MSPPAHAITVLYFAAASTATNLTHEHIPLSPGFTLSALPALLAARHPGTGLAAILAASQWAVDAEMVADPATCVLKGGEEVAVIPPVSGG